MSKRKRSQSGATGRYPWDKPNARDESELRFRIDHDDKLVHVNFGKSVAWFAVPPEAARKLALGLLDHAEQIDGRKTTVILK